MQAGATRAQVATPAEDGNPTTGDLFSFGASNTETPTHPDPLGAMGIGEPGTIGSAPAVHDAVIDALSHLGVRHVDMPLTPQAVWRAVEAAR